MRTLQRIGIALFAGLYRLYYRTLRVTALLPDGTAIAPDDYPFGIEIFAATEADSVALAGLMARRNFTVLVAHGRDGDWVSAALGALGCRIVRGSSRRGGVEALRALAADRAIARGPVALVVDGPLGPAGVAKGGAAMLSKRTGLPICAIGAAARRRMTLRRTWARMYIPLPFTRVVLALESPASDEVCGTSVGAEGVTRALSRARGRARDAMNRPHPPGLRLLRAVLTALVLLRDLLLTGLVVILACPLWVLPWRGALTLGRVYGVVLGASWPLARRAGMINVSRAYGPATSRDQAERIVWRSFASLGQGIAEGIQFARRFKHGGTRWQELYEAEDPALEHRILGDPRPKIFVTGHLGSWEIAAGLAGRGVGDRGAIIIRRIDNVFLNALVRRLRLRRRSQWIDKKGAAAGALARLRAGESVALLLDENAGPRGVFVDFFGRPASTGRLAALLSLNTGAPIVVGACVRRPGRQFLYRLAVVEPSPSTRNANAASVAAITQAVVATFEQWVRDDPGQWRWVHWRWKARPDGSEESYGRGELADCFLHDRQDAAHANHGTFA